MMPARHQGLLRLFIACALPLLLVSVAVLSAFIKNIGALAINYFTLALFGVDNWFLWFIIFAIVQVLNTMLGIEAIDKFAFFAAPCIILITCWMFYKVNALAVLNHVDILGYVPPHPSASCWLITMCANMGMWAALAVDIPNMTRALKAPVGERR